MPETSYRSCPLCEATCGLEITHEGGVVTRIRGDRDDVFSRGFVCPKGASLKALHEDPDRLTRPCVREGEQWREVSWEEAFAVVEKGLAPWVEQGAVGAYLGNPNVHNLAGSFYMGPLLKSLRTRNIFSASTVDQMPKHVSSGLLFGGSGLIPVPDLDRTQYLLMLGANPLESNGSLCTAPDFPGRLAAIRERGGKVVVVDPRRTRTAKRADEHLPIRPGSDVYFLLAIAQVLFAEDRVTLGAAEGWVLGLEEVEALVADFTPERTATLTGVAADTTRRIARELAEAESAAVYGRIGTHTVEFGTLTSWANDLLNLLTGNLDRAGGAMFPNAAHGRPVHKRPEGSEPVGGRGYALGRWHSRVRKLPEIQGELPCATLADEIETPGEGQMRALVTVAGYPVLSTPIGARVDRALAQLDFMVSVDAYRNETTRHANVILPVPSPLERSHYDLAFYGLAVRNVANFSEPVFESEAMSEAEILARLALIAQGLGAQADPALVDSLLIARVLQAAVADEQTPLASRDPKELEAMLCDGPTTDKLVDAMLRSGPYGDGFGARPDGLSVEKLKQHPHGIDLGPLEPRLPEILRTPSGRIELAAPPIVEDFKRLRAAFDAGPGADSLVLIGRRHVRSNNSWMHNLEPLVSGKPRCTLQLHPKDALEAGLEAGDTARVRSRVGEIEVPVELVDDIMPGVVSLPHGWGHGREGAQLRVAAQKSGVSVNDLTDELELDALSGNAVLNGVPVSIERVAGDR